MWHNRKPSLMYLRVFGSTVYVHNKLPKSKFENKSWKGILVGYVQNGYKVCVLETGKFVTARDVIIDETNMFKSRPSIESNDLEICSGVHVDTHNVPVCETGGEKTSDHDDSDCPENNSGESDTDRLSVDGTPSMISREENANFENKSPKRNSIKRQNDSEIRKSKRISQMPKISYNEDRYLMLVDNIDNSIPTCLADIQSRSDKVQWEKAIQEELDSHFQSKTWSIVEKPENKNIVDCRWVFTIKFDELGNAVRYKACLVARGFTQQYLIDFDETFAPVARIASFRFLLAYSNQNNLLIHHMDVKTAFLNGLLKEEIYMTIPEGLSCDEGKVCKLNKAIYGLKQAARCWFEVFEKTLKESGFQNSFSDRCIYVLNKGDISSNIYVLLYVDDVVISTRNINVLTAFKKHLMNKFKMTDLLDIKYFIGIRIERSDNKICLSQTAYIQKVLKKFNMNECKPVSTPLPSQLNYDELDLEEKCDAPCQQLIGCLMYIMLCTRPDLSAAVNILSRYSNKNNKELWQNLKRVLRYLKGTLELKLVYEKNENYTETCVGYVDSDWGGCTKDRRSTTGYIFKLFEKCSICWNTMKQKSVAASSTEAEYMALFEAVREARWLKLLAESINFKLKRPIVIFEDNQGCIIIATNTSCHKRSKHIDIKYHFTREQVQNGEILIKYIPTKDQIADLLTKSLPTTQYLILRDKFGLEF